MKVLYEWESGSGLSKLRQRFVSYLDESVYQRDYITLECLTKEGEWYVLHELDNPSLVEAIRYLIGKATE